jgi:hypothetical protein
MILSLAISVFAVKSSIFIEPGENVVGKTGAGLHCHCPQNDSQNYSIPVKAFMPPVFRLGLRRL